MSDANRKLEWTPWKDRTSDCMNSSPSLIYKCHEERCPPFEKNDPFIHPAILKKTCSVLALPSDEGRVPSFSVNNGHIEDTIDFTDEDWADITQSQLEWESRELEKEKEREASDLEKQQKKEASVDTHMKKTLDCKVDRIFERHYHFIKKTCPVMIPYKSSLNHDEHKAYLRAFVKFKIRSPVTAAEAVEYENYLRLQNRVYEEQQCFMRFAYQVARLQLKSYNDVPDVINSYVSDYVKVSTHY
ncbi:uncharacterized protein [Macrobrachium rosenbergii]|uniref:uncharacterized protein isoform X2 n=1 Tax=Macrobrachium rosenbergii TaxID=79674 RepID=UPI0034D73380